MYGARVNPNKTVSFCLPDVFFSVFLSFIRPIKCYDFGISSNVSMLWIVQHSQYKRSKYKRKKLFLCFVSNPKQFFFFFNFVCIFKVAAVSALKLNHQQAINLKIIWTKIMWHANGLLLLHLCEQWTWFWMNTNRVQFDTKFTFLLGFPLIISYEIVWIVYSSSMWIVSRRLTISNWI